MSATEDTKKDSSEDKEIIDKDTLIYLGLGAGGLALAGVLAMAGMGWMKEQDQEKKRQALQKQQLEVAQRALQQRRQPQQQEGWPNPIPRNTIPQSSGGVMELPSEDESREQQEDQFVGYRQPPPTAYNTNEQKFLVSDDPMANMNYPVINPNASPQQIGSKISRVMSMDGQYQPNSQQQQQPPNMQQIRQQGDDEDFSDLF